MDLFTLVARLTLDKSEYSNSMNEAGEEAQSFGDKMSGGLNKAKVAAAAVVGVGSVILGTTKKVAQHGDEIDKMSQKLNMSATAYQEWAHILEHSGSSINSLQPSMKTLANAVETGSDAFEKLGLNLDDLKNMSQENIFSETIKALQNVESETERTYLAGQLLGRGATELGPLLNTSAEDVEDMRKKLHEMGGVMSDEAVKASADFEDALTDLKAGFAGAGNALFSELLPYLTEFMNSISDWVADGGLEKLKDTFEDLAPVVSAAGTAFVAYKASVAISGVVEALTKATESQTIAQAALNTVMNANPFVLVATLIAGLVTALIVLYNTNEDFRKKVDEVWTIVQDTITNVINAITAKFEEIKAKVTEAMNAFEDFKNKVSSAITTAKDTFTNGINAMKNALNFSWKLPDLKIPHISVSGGEAPYGLGGKGSLPQFSIQWYRKAYDDPIMFTNPTVIPTAYGLKGFGDGPGAEVVMSMDKLRQMTGGYTQNLYFYSSEPADPSEIARQTRNANREAVLALKGLR